MVRQRGIRLPYPPERSFFLRASFLVPVALVVLAVLSLFLFYTKDCGDDASCFDRNARSCWPAQVSLSQTGSVYHYEIKGKHDSDCIFLVRLEKLSLESGADLQKALEGKEMTCFVPRSLLQEKNFREISGLMSYCTGPLKEASLEISLQKMYELVVKNLGPLAGEFKNVLSK